MGGRAPLYPHQIVKTMHAIQSFVFHLCTGRDCIGRPAIAGKEAASQAELKCRICECYITGGELGLFRNTSSVVLALFNKSLNISNEAQMPAKALEIFWLWTSQFLGVRFSDLMRTI